MDATNFKIISGGQTGADRAGLDVAIELGIPHGGWCPKGRLAEDGRIANVYKLKETATSRYPERTRVNVRDADGTVIFASVPLSGGTKLTGGLCQSLRKPFVVIEPSSSVEQGARQLLDFMEAHHVQVLNVAGPRASSEPSICGFTRAVITAALGNRVAQRD